MVDVKHLAGKTYSTHNSWRSRGYLHHFNALETTQFITCRLFDSLPKDVICKLVADKRYSLLNPKKWDRIIDRGYGACFLLLPRVAEILQESFLYHDGKRYRLHAWVIMPNHFHLLVTLLEDWDLGAVIKNIKSVSAHRANQLLSRTGKFWATEYFDRYIRDSDHYQRVVNYVEQNPVKAGLCQSATDWRFSSAYLG